MLAITVICLFIQNHLIFISRPFHMLSHCFMLFCYSTIDRRWSSLLWLYSFIRNAIKQIFLFSNLLSGSGSGEICSVIYSKLLLCWGKCNLHFQVSGRAASQRTIALRLHTYSGILHWIELFYAIKFHLPLMRNINNRKIKLSRNHQSAKFRQNIEELFSVLFPSWNISVSKFMNTLNICIRISTFHFILYWMSYKMKSILFLV